MAPLRGPTAKFSGRRAKAAQDKQKRRFGGPLERIVGRKCSFGFGNELSQKNL